MTKNEASNSRPSTSAPSGTEKNHQATSRLPRKKFFRARAHANPLSDSTQADIPLRPELVDWTSHYPSVPQPVVRFVDIGCGFGGLLIRLSPLYPDSMMLGMELRDKVSNYVRERIIALRRESQGGFANVSVIRTNAMRFLPHYFTKGQLTKMFFLFPDPHFKAANHRRRIINTTLITEYAYLLAEGGRLYTITDVKDLGDWMRAKLDSHPMFERLSDEELEDDPAAGLLTEATEEGQKVARNKGSTYRNVYRRLASPKWSNVKIESINR